ncbi:MAG: DUF1080 domain-containing protein [Planctomycetota bacterium]|nr:DUF1080 domain-containing protein [Planctomycetota bacterium]
MKRFEIACLWSACVLMAAAVMIGGCTKSSSPPDEKSPDAKSPAAGAAKLPGLPNAEGWMSLFDGKTLAGWKMSDFVKPGTVAAKDGEIALVMGKEGDLTGITWAGGEIPTSNYEVEVKAKRTDGGDFFCALTFPIGKSFASFVVGGWGGSLVGISCLDGYDASENTTTKTMTFENGKWYTIRVRVNDERLQALIDDEQMVDVETKEHKFSVRWEVEASQPLGLAAWRTSANWKDLRVRKVSE